MVSSGQSGPVTAYLSGPVRARLVRRGPLTLAQAAGLTDTWHDLEWIVGQVDAACIGRTKTIRGH